MIFTYQDLEAAKFILNNKVSITGVRLYNSNWIKWAKSVISFFRKFWQTFKRLLKHYRYPDLTLKATWLYIKGERQQRAYKQRRQDTTAALKGELTANSKGSLKRKVYFAEKMRRIDKANSITVQKALDKEERRRKAAARKLKYAAIA